MAITTVQQTTEVYKSAVDSISIDVYSAGTAVSVSGLSFRLLGSGGNVVRSGTPSTPSTGRITAATLATDFTSVEEDCRCEFTFTAAGAVYVINTLFDVVVYKTLSPLITSKLLQYFPQLDEHEWTGKTNWEEQIQLAWFEVRADLRVKGISPRMLVSSGRIEPLIIYKALELIFWPMQRQRDGSPWRQFYEDAKERYAALLETTPLPLDTGGDDGTVDVQHVGGTVSLDR